jgi:uncharacterized phage-like protein YoqJ
MIYAATGHRPDKLDGYGVMPFLRLTQLAEASLRTLAPTKIISGMALGWDQAIASASSHLKIEWIAAIPFKGQELAWPEASQRIYATILKHASQVIYVCEPGYKASKLQKRNEWMVDNADAILALWNGSPGGTANCIQYAQSKGKPITNVWSSWIKFKDKPLETTCTPSH